MMIRKAQGEGAESTLWIPKRTAEDTGEERKKDRGRGCVDGVVMDEWTDGWGDEEEEEEEAG